MSLIRRLLGSLQRVGEERKSGSRHTRRAVGFELHETPMSTSPDARRKGRRGHRKLQRHCKHLEEEEEFLLLLDSDTLSECESVRERIARRH